MSINETTAKQVCYQMSYLIGLLFRGMDWWQYYEYILALIVICIWATYIWNIVSVHPVASMYNALASSFLNHPPYASSLSAQLEITAEIAVVHLYNSKRGCICGGIHHGYDAYQQISKLIVIASDKPRFVLLSAGCETRARSAPSLHCYFLGTNSPVGRFYTSKGSLLSFRQSLFALLARVST